MAPVDSVLVGLQAPASIRQTARMAKYYIYLIKGWPQPATQRSKPLYDQHPCLGEFDSLEEFNRAYYALHEAAIRRWSGSPRSRTTVGRQRRKGQGGHVR
jgi:hypothetical protein